MRAIAGMPGGFHFRRRLDEGRDDVADVVKALAALVEPVGADARTVQWLDELVSRAAIIQDESEAPLGRMAAVLAALALQAENPPAPRSGGEPRIELAGRALEIADDERDLERGDAFERRNHPPDSTPRSFRDEWLDGSPGDIQHRWAQARGLVTGRRSGRAQRVDRRGLDEAGDGPCQILVGGDEDVRL